jgi:2-polyprenyl-3-methyl-5-hydroxy-6-metoxy-1,4-benzoquinol methylase
MAFNASGYWKNDEWILDKFYRTTYGQYTTKCCLDFITKNLESSERNLHILDVGGGNGRFAIPLIERGHQVTINELDDKLIEILKREQPALSAIAGDFLHLKLEQQFDAIICLGTIKLMDVKIEKILDKFSRVLKPGGKLIFEMINPDCIRKKIRNPSNYTQYYTECPPELLEKTLLKLGFKNIKMKGLAALTPPVRYNFSFLVFIASFLEKQFNLHNRLSLCGSYLTYAENRIA